MERPYILHMFTPGAQMSPFDVNMAADAGYQIITPYCGVGLDAISGLTQDAIFSRGPKGVARTGIFIGGRDVILAADMLLRAKKSMVPPFVVSLFADPSGSYTTAAAMVACAEAALEQHHGGDLKGRKLLILGGTGTVGRIAGVLAAQLGADVHLASHRGAAAAQAAADETGKRFGVTMKGTGSKDAAELRAALADANLVFGAAAAGVQVMSEADRAHALALEVAADVNAVPPEGLAGVGVMDDAKPLAGTKGVGIGALAVGNVKYQTQHRLLVRMREAAELGPPRSLRSLPPEGAGPTWERPGVGPVAFDFADAFAVAREVLAEKNAASR
jgi:methylene-tetrahydromethanopterin dehydrogenase